MLALTSIRRDPSGRSAIWLVAKDSHVTPGRQPSDNRELNPADPHPDHFCFDFKPDHCQLNFSHYRSGGQDHFGHQHTTQQQGRSFISPQEMEITKQNLIPDSVDSTYSCSDSTSNSPSSISTRTAGSIRYASCESWFARELEYVYIRGNDINECASWKCKSVSSLSGLLLVTKERELRGGQSVKRQIRSAFSWHVFIISWLLNHSIYKADKARNDRNVTYLSPARVLRSGKSVGDIGIAYCKSLRASL
jgi:hypothetical protein